jgi:hypothetical protein
MDEPKIVVAIRKRPLAKKEESKGETDIISVKNGETVIVSEYKYQTSYADRKSISPNTSRRPSSTSTMLSTRKPPTNRYAPLHSDL